MASEKVVKVIKPSGKKKKHKQVKNINILYFLGARAHLNESVKF